VEGKQSQEKEAKPFVICRFAKQGGCVVFKPSLFVKCIEKGRK
jgi:hypothetical protein